MKKTFAIVLIVFLFLNSFTIPNSLAAQSVNKNVNTSAINLNDGYLYLSVNGISKKVNLKIKFYCDGQKDYILACTDSSNGYKYVLINKKTLSIRKLKYTYIKKFCDDSVSPILAYKNNKYYFLSQNLVVESNGTKEKIVYNSKSSKTESQQFSLSQILTSNNKIVFWCTYDGKNIVIDTRTDSIGQLESGGQLIGITDKRVCYLNEEHIPASTDTVYIYMSDYDKGNSKKLMTVGGALYNNYSAQIGDKAYYSNYINGIYMIDLSKETTKLIFKRPVLGMFIFEKKLYISTLCDESYKNYDPMITFMGNDSIGFIDLVNYKYTNVVQITNNEIIKDLKYDNSCISLSKIDFFGNYIFEFGVTFDSGEEFDNSCRIVCKYDIQKKKVIIIDMSGSFSHRSSLNKFEDLKKKYIGKDITDIFQVK